MNKETAQTVKEGNELNLIHTTTTPGRKFSPILGGNVKVLRIATESTGYTHFDIGMVIAEGENALLSRDTGAVIDGTNTYWLHPSRFEKLEQDKNQ